MGFRLRSVMKVVAVIGVVVAVPGVTAPVGADPAPTDATTSAIGPVVIGNYGDKVNRNGCMDVENGGAGPFIQMWECHYGLNQWFEFRDSPTLGYYVMRNMQSGKCVDGAWGRGQQVRQYTCDGTATQEWQVYATDLNQWVIVNRQNGLCLDMKDSGTSRAVQLWSCYWVSQQRWYFRYP